jgi:proteasome lid subunit RPN8/RPN11
MLIGSHVLDAVVAHARECQPGECCGILVGENERVVASVRARNLDDNPSRFLIDPRDHIAAYKDARAQDLDIVGFYHSHPHSEAYPSPTDLAEAAYPGVLYLIVGLQGEPPEIRLFRLGGETVEELPVTREF